MLDIMEREKLFSLYLVFSPCIGKMILSWKTFSDLKVKNLGGYYMCLWCFLEKK